MGWDEKERDAVDKRLDEIGQALDQMAEQLHVMRFTVLRLHDEVTGYKEERMKV